MRVSTGTATKPSSAGRAERPRLALLGPVTPYRGGIAQYTTQLKRSLERIADLTTISFKRQYPEWLYPGKTDKEPGHRDQWEPRVVYSLDPLSPLSWHRAANGVITEGCACAILTWWTLFWAIPFSYIAWRLRRNGIRTIFLCHNLIDHDSAGLKAWLARQLLSQADGYVVHSREQAAILKAIEPTKPVLQRLHPVYAQFPEPSTHLPKRGRLELLFFGFIRPYKGLDVLLDALIQLRDTEVYLTIVGEIWGDDAKVVAAAGRADIHVEAHLHYVDEQTAATYFERADVVVLPYLAATGSGVVALAYHYRKPVLASRVGGLEDAVIPGETGWLSQPGSATALAEHLVAINRNMAAGFESGIQTFVQRNGWGAMATAICEFLAEQPTVRVQPCP